MKFNFYVERKTGVPSYLQIVEHAIETLHIGKIVLGDHLPFVSEVVQITAINANTVMEAYRELKPLQSLRHSKELERV